MINQILTEARTHHHWLQKPVPDKTLQEIYDLAKWGPTHMNTFPMRILFIKSEKAKLKLQTAITKSNTRQVTESPVTAVIAYDAEFYNYLDPKLKLTFVTNKTLSEQTSFRNGTLQGAYFMIAARSLGLDVGPMSGFDNTLVDQTFFKDTRWKSNFLCNLGYADHSKVSERETRLSFKDACKII